MATMDNENEDSWLYENDALKEGSENPMDSHNTEKEELEKLEAMEIFEQDGNVDKNVNGTKSGPDDMHDFMEGDDVTNHHDDDDDTNKSDFDDSGDDDVEVTLNSINEIYDKYPSQSGGIPVGVPSSLPTASSMKPPAKGIDVDVIGNIKGVPIYEYDLNSIKIDEKPWRKPGADITDYFNYGFTEDSWMKYCEKQRRLRLENNCRTGLIVGNGQIAGETANDLDATYLGLNRRQSGQRMTTGVVGQDSRGPSKSSGLIDVIGSTQRDSRRPQQEFTEIPTSQSSATSVATVMPISMSIPPPMLNMPPPDFAIPPPSSLPPGALGHPVIGPPGIIGHPPILVAPPPNFAPPPMAGQFDPFFRPPIIGGPPPSAVNHNSDRRGVPGFPDRPPFRMENIYGAPPNFQGPPGIPPPLWDSRKMTLHQEERPPQWVRSGSRSRDSEISSSSTEDNGGQKSVEKFETTDRKSPAYSREESRHRSRDRSRHHEYDRERGTRERERDRRRDYEGSRSSRHSRHRGYREEERSSRHYSSRRRDKSPHDEYKPSNSRYSSRKHRHDKSRSSSTTSDKDRRKSRSSSPDHKK